MDILIKLLRDSYDLQEEKPEETAYWHLQQLRAAIKDEESKVNVTLGSVSERLEENENTIDSINSIMWASFMLKNVGLKDSDGTKIMAELEKWANR